MHSDFSVVEVIKKSLAFIEPLLKDITVITNFENDIILSGYENEFVQSIINIINNARDAVSTKEEKLIFINTNIEHGKYVIEILDNGGVISTEVINRILNHILQLSIKVLGQD